MALARKLLAPMLSLVMLTIGVEMTLAASGAFGASSYHAHKLLGDTIVPLVALSFVLPLLGRIFAVLLADSWSP